MKRLIEYIEELPAGQKVRIGSGSGFFYIGQDYTDNWTDLTTHFC